MPIKRYGIYVAYAPTVDLRHEGLGRYLAAFIRGASQSSGVEFVIACPSWSRESLEALFKSEGLNDVSVLSPTGKPYLLRAYELYQRLTSQRTRKSRKSKLQRLLKVCCEDFEKSLAQASSPLAVTPLIISGLAMILLAMACSPFVALKKLTSASKSIFSSSSSKLVKLKSRLRRITTSPKDNGKVFHMFKSMHEAETERMRTLIEAREDIIAWYSPTAFWPAFNRLDVPRLMCVPDVVLTEFSISFSSINGDRFLETFENVSHAIRGAEHLVTYSENVKWSTLVDHFGVPAQRATVIHHAPNLLNHLIDVSGFQDPEATSRTFCRRLLINAINRANTRYTDFFLNDQVRFLFYPSQIRPNKNILTLLRAFKHLLHDRKLGLKLILTCDLSLAPELAAYIHQHRLQNDVISLRKLSMTELAACYRLAELAVNPSLSEGGCPFTFTEALSVGTPVVMSRLPVTLEVLTDPGVQEATLFDPYDWQCMSARVEWAIKNRGQLLSLQQSTYERLIERDWSDVTREHMDLLDDIAAKANADRSQYREKHHVKTTPA